MPYVITLRLGVFDDPRVPEAKKTAIIEALLDALTLADRAWIEAHPEAPALRDADVHYEEEPAGQDIWQDTPELYRTRIGDCEDLGAARAGELQAEGVPARARAISQRQGRSVTYHVVDDTPWGQEDPSRRLGMI